jgi:predicted Zn-dependent protease
MPSARTRCAIVLLVFVAAGCSINEQKEIEMGRQSHLKFEQEFGGKYPDSQLQAYVSQVGMTVAKPAGRPNLDWQFAVLNGKEVNAFAVPGGYIYVTQGLLFRLENEAMLAGVLGHESAHIAHRHSVQQIGRGQTTQGLSTAVGIVGGLFGFGWAGDVTSVVGSLSLMSYGRGQEKEADISGLKYMVDVGYDPNGMVQTMTVLQQASGKGGGAPEFLSTHPNPGNRLEYLKAEINKKYAAAAGGGKVGRDEFTRNVLARRIGALPPLPENAATWCAHCREEAETGKRLANARNN